MIVNGLAGLSCRGLRKSFGDREVLGGLDLDVAAGSVTAILGSSGAGKTTLLRLVMGLERLDAGHIGVGGTILADERVHVPTERRRVGYVSQEGALFPQLTVRENIAFGLPRGERKSSGRVHEVLVLVGLSDHFLDRNPAQLSGGEQRRVALARALSPRPNLILLDEPFSGLDAALRVETREAVLGALAQAEATALLVTHDQSEALSTGDEVGVLRDGRLVQVDEPQLLYRSPADLGVARFVGEAVVLPGTVHADRVSCALGTLPCGDDAASGHVDVMIRPEQIRIATRSDRDGPEDPPNTWDGAPTRAVVTRRRFLGPDVVVFLDLWDASTGQVTELTARTRSQDAPSVGETVVLRVEGPVRAYARGQGEAPSW
jgi:iron(III) transport system ATP-binding protein